jgi:putative Holliday junction resolvase
MGRILAIDYGRKRCGVAVTDILKIAANGLPTVATKDILKFIKDYCAKEDVEEIVIGQPKTLRNEPSESMKYINPFLGQLRKELPDMKVTMFDERFTSSIAHREMLAAGLKKSDRQRKELADEMAATIILTDYLQSRQFGSLF